MNKQIYRDIALVAIGGALSLVAYKLFSKLTRKHHAKVENDKFQQSNEIIQEISKQEQSRKRVQFADPISQVLGSTDEILVDRDKIDYHTNNPLNDTLNESALPVDLSYMEIPDENSKHESRENDVYHNSEEFDANSNESKDINSSFDPLLMPSSSYSRFTSTLNEINDSEDDPIHYPHSY